MLEFLREKASERKLRLFACACCRRIWRFFPGESRARNAVSVSERFADGLATKTELRIARKQAWGSEWGTALGNAYEAAVETARKVADEVCSLVGDGGRDPFLGGCSTDIAAAIRLSSEQSAEQSVLFRDIFGNPFRPLPTIAPSILTWNDATIPNLAQQIYDERRFEEMPILGDALMDAGCHDEEILTHCQSREPHAKGCWVVDLLTGRD
jgi:hypothetical protein